MQDVQEILGGGGGRIFGDRRLRVAANGIHHPLKCPRCDSLNTKFCYYNNYNLSQPRHFCKNCRRYWTKGGVLRNVPVGGGCRKSKRSSKSKPKPNSRSTSETTSDNAVGSGKAIGAGSEYSSSPLLNFSDEPPAPLPTCSALDAAGIVTADPGGGGMFTEMGGFVSLMDGNHEHQNWLSFGGVETTPFGMHQQNQLSAPRDWQKGVFDQTVQVNLTPNSRRDAVPDWNGVGGLFDLTPGSDWSQSWQWNESDDHHLYLPP